ncbi:MAG: ABC transporter permease [Bacteroidetes bacterium]|nr:ABC transporter permease [Bacteroidota bacterium]
MNLETFIAKRFLIKNKKNISQPIIRVAIIGIALGIAVMIIAVATVTGFQQKITEKVIGFGGHIQIGNFDLNNSYESLPIEKNKMLENELKRINGISHIQVFANKAGMIKTDEQIQGFILKGVGSDFDWSFMKKNIVQGQIIQINNIEKTNDVIISKYLADKLKLKLNDKLKTYFIGDDGLRGRPFLIKGIYETGLEEFDKKFVFADIAHIQKLNKWDVNKIDGYEVLIKDFDQLDKISNEVYQAIGYNLNAKNIKELHPEIFDWLGLTNMNVIVIIVIISLVSSVTMISTLLILILEKTNLIGILKALGANNLNIRKIFIYNVLYITFQGMLLGNFVALTLGLVQQKFGIMKLDQASYYVKTVPIALNLWHILLINLGSISVCILALLIPSYIVSKITVVKAIRFN